MNLNNLNYTLHVVICSTIELRGTSVFKQRSQVSILMTASEL
jgi:hypothetical protein